MRAWVKVEALERGSRLIMKRAWWQAKSIWWW